jgi:hypothetical protein
MEGWMIDTQLGYYCFDEKRIDLDASSRLISQGFISFESNLVVFLHKKNQMHMLIHKK